MGGIPQEHVEWAVVNRMKRMLETPREDFSVTETFALFSSTVLWVKNRAWTPDHAAGQGDIDARSVRQQLAASPILGEPWNLSRSIPNWLGGGGGGGSDRTVRLLARPVNDDFKEMSAENFFRWLRDALAHGDGRTVTPLNRPAPNQGTQWLAGFEIKFNATRGSKTNLHLTLTKDDMRRLGMKLAEMFCETLAGGNDFDQQDHATRIVEVGSERVLLTAR